jgi:RNA polymerase sigma-70 factor (sigma-E family)
LRQAYSHNIDLRKAEIPGGGRQLFAEPWDLTGMGRPSRREPLALLHECHYSELVRLAFALTGDWGLAEDLAQEAFVRVWRGWANIRDQQSAPAYLRTTVVNLARRSLRRGLRERQAWSGIGDPLSADPGTDIDLLRALARLPSGKRACVVLRYYLDLSEADTAAVLGVSVGTVKSQTAKALLRLQALLAEPGNTSALRPGHDDGGA